MSSALSVVIITRNEEQRVARAIRSVDQIADDVVVIDSESDDQTCEIARAHGAKVHVHPWLGWVGQKNYGATLAANDWILFLDADEIVTPQLAEQIKKALAADPDPTSGFSFERQEEFLGHIMIDSRRKRISRRFIRVFNRLHSRWDDKYLIHEGVYCEGSVEFLTGKLIHWRNYTIDEQITTFNKNAYFEAKMILNANPGGAPPLTVAFKPILRFIWVYVACGNWRLGMRGYLWAGMNAASEFFRQAKAWEAKHAPRAIDPPLPVYRQSLADGGRGESSLTTEHPGSAS